jgi:hypothetical protein
MKHIVNNSKEIGDFDNRIIYHVNVKGHDVYSYISSNKIDAIVFLHGNNLRGIQNYSNLPGMITALVAFITHRMKKKIIITAQEPLTPAGFRWLYGLLAADGRGLTITDQTGKYPDKDSLKHEWEKAMTTDSHGSTTIVIESNMKRHFNSVTEYNDLIFKHTFFIGDKRIT